MIKLLLAVALSAQAGSPKAAGAAAPGAPARPEPRLLSPVTSGGTPVVFRLIRLDVPPNESAQIDVAMTKEGTECFDTSIIDWNKSMINGKRFHSINFDASRANREPGCARRASGHLGLHSVTLPPEKGGMHVTITYREGTEVRATLTK